MVVRTMACGRKMWQNQKAQPCVRTSRDEKGQDWVEWEGKRVAVARAHRGGESLDAHRCLSDLLSGPPDFHFYLKAKLTMLSLFVNKDLLEPSHACYLCLLSA